MLPHSLARFYCQNLFARPFWLIMFFGALMFARVVQYTLYPLASKYVIAWIENPPAADLLGYAMPWLWLFAGVVLVVLGAWLMRYWYQRKIEEFSKIKISETLLDYVNRQSIQFYAKTEPGKIARNIDYIHTGFYQVCLVGIPAIITSTVVTLLSAGLLLRINIWLSVALIVSMLMQAAWAWFSTPQLVRASEKYADTDSEVSGKLNDSLSNFITVKLFAGAKREQAALTPVRRRLFRAGMRNERADMWFWAPFSYMSDTVTIVGFGISIYLAMAGAITIPDAVFGIVAFKTVADFIFETLLDIPTIIKAYSSARAAWRELVQPVTLADYPGAGTLRVTAGRIDVDNVSFRFDDGHEWVLRDFNLTIAPGERVGIVGLSGNGKTTLARLIMRFYDPQRGAIKIDGTDIRDVTQDSLRRAIAFVPQDETMFNRTLAENIGYGRDHATNAQITDAAHQSNAYEFIMKTARKFRTVVGTRGIKLSGGQRQRISIARAFVKDAPILILDEATSALDSQSEDVIQKSLAQLTHGRTCLVIAHRLSTLKHMDRIVVLDGGKIVETGTHAQLIGRRRGVYAKLWKMQSCGFIGQ